MRSHRGFWASGLYLFVATSLAIDFTPNGTQPGLNHGLNSALECAGCHQSDNEPGDNHELFMPWPSWSGSMMANATRDPLFWAALDVANNDVPGVGDYCLRCHTPFGWLGGRVKNASPDGCDLSGSFTAADNSQNDYQGLTCHFCHRLDSEGPGGESLMTNGNFWIDDEDCDGFGEPCRKGPYDYTDGGGSTPPHAWEYSSFIESSGMCGTCHDVSSPTTDEGILKTLILEDGTDTGIAFPIERTYSEWQQSRFADLVFADHLGDSVTTTPALTEGQTCQNCHMPISEDPDALACSFDAAGRRTGDLPVHRLVGANTWIPQVLKGEYGMPGMLDRESAFDNTTLWATELLQDAAELEVSVGSVVAESLSASVIVTNLSGHKLPSGYAEGRRMWLNIEAKDNNGQVIFESGGYDNATGALTVDAQAKVYEVVHGEWNGDASECVTHDDSPQPKRQFHFVLNDCIKSDNRIPPLGFSGKDDVETQPVGYSYPINADGSLVNFDQTDYSIPVPAATPMPVTVTARLYFQTSSREYIEFLRDQAVDNGFPSENAMCRPDEPWTEGPADLSRGQFMYNLWENYGRSAPVMMASDTQSTP